MVSKVKQKFFSKIRNSSIRKKKCLKLIFTGRSSNTVSFWLLALFHINKFLQRFFYQHGDLSMITTHDNLFEYT